MPPPRSATCSWLSAWTTSHPNRPGLPPRKCWPPEPRRLGHRHHQAQRTTRPDTHAGSSRPPRRHPRLGRRPPSSRSRPARTQQRRTRSPPSDGRQVSGRAVGRAGRRARPRLIDQTDWPATATILDQAHEQGHDVTATAHALVAERALGDQPARDLRYRLVSRLEVTINTGEQSLDIAATSSNGAEHPHQRQARNQATPGRGPKR